MGNKGRFAGALALGAAMLTNPGAVAEGAARGCALWAHTVMPGLLPFMICGLYAAGHMRPGKQGRWTLMGVSRAGGLLGGMGWFVGSPGGARLLAEGCRRGWLCAGEAARLAVYTGVMSPMFVLGTLADWAGMPGQGWRLLCAHWLGVLGAGQALRLIPEKEVFLRVAAEQAPPMTLPRAVREACTALITVAGCMATACGLSELLKTIFPGWPAGLAAAVQCALEVTAGCRALVEAGFPGWCLAGAVSLGGLALWLQNLLFYPPGLPLGRIALGRVIAGGLSLGFGWLLRPQSLTAFAPAVSPAAPPILWGLCVFAALTLWSVCRREPSGSG